MLIINEDDELCTEPRGRVKNQDMGGVENKTVALLYVAPFSVVCLLFTNSKAARQWDGAIPIWFIWTEPLEVKDNGIPQVLCFHLSNPVNLLDRKFAALTVLISIPPKSLKTFLKNTILEVGL